MKFIKNWTLSWVKEANKFVKEITCREFYRISALKPSQNYFHNFLQGILFVSFIRVQVFILFV